MSISRRIKRSCFAMLGMIFSSQIIEVEAAELTLVERTVLAIDFDESNFKNERNGMTYSAGGVFASSKKGKSWQPNGSTLVIPFSDLGISEADKTLTFSFLMDAKGVDGLFMPYSMHQPGISDVWLNQGRFGLNTNQGDNYGVEATNIVGTGQRHIIVEMTQGDVKQGRMWIDGIEQELEAVGDGRPSVSIAWNASTKLGISGCSTCGAEYSTQDGTTFDEFTVIKGSTTEQDRQWLNFSHSLGSLSAQYQQVLEMNFDDGSYANELTGKIYTPQEGNPAIVSSSKGSGYQANGSMLSIPFTDLGHLGESEVMTASFLLDIRDADSFMPMSVGGDGAMFDVWMHGLQSGSTGVHPMGMFFNTFNSDLFGREWDGAPSGIIHVVAEFHKGKMELNRLWIDGAEVSIETAIPPHIYTRSWGNGSVFTLSGGPTLAQNPAYRSEGKSVIDEVKLFTGSLSDAEIEAIAKEAIAATEPTLNNYRIENQTESGFDFIVQFSSLKEVTALHLPFWKDGNKDGAKAWDAAIQLVGPNTFKIPVRFSEIGAGTDYVWHDLYAQSDGEWVSHGATPMKLDTVAPTISTAVSTTSKTNKPVTLTATMMDDWNVVDTISFGKKGETTETVDLAGKFNILLVYLGVNNPPSLGILNNNGYSNVKVVSSAEITTAEQLASYDLVIYDNSAWGATNAVFNAALNEYYESGGDVITTFNDGVSTLYPVTPIQAFGQTVSYSFAKPDTAQGQSSVGRTTRFAEPLVGAAEADAYHTMWAKHSNDVVLKVHNEAGPNPITDGVVYQTREAGNKWIHIQVRSVNVSGPSVLLNAIDEIMTGKMQPKQTYRHSFEVAENGIYELTATDFAGNQTSETIVIDNIVPGEVELTTKQTANGVQLDWTIDMDDQSFTYEALRKRIGEESYVPVGSQQLRDRVNVLNIYPDVGTLSTYETWDGETMTLPAAANLKRWMEMPNAEHEKGYGMGIIEVLPTTMLEFNTNPSDILYQATSGPHVGKWVTSIRGEEEVIDAIMVGSWDANKEQRFSDKSVAVVTEFIDDSMPVVFGHDTVWYKEVEFWSFAKYLNLVRQEQLVNEANQSLIVGGGQVQSRRKGLIAEYPWAIPEGELIIPRTHSGYQMAKQEDVWFNFSRPNDGEDGLDTPNATEQLFEYDGYTNNHYLVLRNNVAMVQTGHSNGAATADEQKILANTLFYLAQETTLVDMTVVDAMALDSHSPGEPILMSPQFQMKGGQLNIHLQVHESVDIGTQYEYKVQAKGNDTGEVFDSNSRFETITSGLKGYSVVIDNHESTIPDSSIEITNIADLATIVYQEEWGNEFYIHVKAIDNAGNESATTHLQVSDAELPVLQFNITPEEATTEPVVIEAVATDTISGVQGIVLPNGRFIPGEQARFTVSTNGQYVFQVVDNVGNSQSFQAVVKNIDKENPSILIQTDPDSEWSNQDVLVQIEAIDN